MFIYLIKFIHLICVLGLLSCTLYCAVSVNAQALQKIHKAILHLALVTIVTGTFLVHPKYFTFHTPWIVAAYILVTVFCFGILLMKKKLISNKFILQSFYFFLFIILILIVHDAVTKITIFQEF